MRLTLKILTLACLISCSEKTENRSIDSESKEPKNIKLSKVILDTLIASYPMKIGNDDGSVKIVGVRTFEDEQLTASSFVISLIGISDFSITKQIDKSVLIDSSETVLLLDTINADYLKSAIIKEVEFDFVRSNTLSFNTVLENSIDGKEIFGRFNLFYRTNKKGVVYGWITDEVK